MQGAKAFQSLEALDPPKNSTRHHSHATDSSSENCHYCQNIGGAQMHYKPCIEIEIIGGARALLPMEVYAYV
jgi:hypothetical protein